MRRILFVSCNYASDYGAMVWGTYIRMRMLLEAATRAAERVDLLLFAAADVLPSADPARIAASLKTHWNLDVTVQVAPRSLAAHGGPLSTLRALLDIRHQQDYGDAGGEIQAGAVAAAIRPDTDLVIAHRLDASLAAMAGARGRRPVVVNFDDIEHIAKQRRLAREPMSIGALMRRIELKALKRAEIGILRAARTALVCSDDERDYLAGIGVGTTIDVINNAVFFPTLASLRRPPSRTVMFIGSYGYGPNVEAAEELITTIFPRILARCPDARLLIAGARPERLPSMRNHHPAVEILGFIDDVATIYTRATVACCAIRAGGGTRIKIIEAAAWGIPTVSTTLGAEGLELDDPSQIVLADTSEALADACIKLLEAPDRAATVGDAARRRAIGTYEHGAVVGRLADSYARAVAGFAPGPDGRGKGAR